MSVAETGRTSPVRPAHIMGIKGDELDQVVAYVVAAGLVERRVDERGLVILTSKGWSIAGN